MNTDNKRLKAALACALGGGLGALIALNIWPWLSWLGLLIGGGVGYVAYDWRHTYQTAIKVWSGLPKCLPLSSKLKHNALYVLHNLVIALMLFALLICLAACLDALCSIKSTFGIAIVHPGTSLKTLWLIYFHDATRGNTPLGTIGPVGSVICSLCGPVSAILFTLLKGSTVCKLSDFLLVVCLSPYAVAVWFLPFFAVVSIAAILAIIAIASFLFTGFIFLGIPKLAKTAWITIRIIHSDGRLLCLTDSIIGGLTGYWYGHFWIGALAGAAVSFIHGEVARIVVPKKSHA